MDNRRLAQLSRPPNNRSKSRTRQPDPTTQLSVAETQLRDELLLYSGPCVGSRPNIPQVCHNLDYSGFAHLIDEVYRECLHEYGFRNWEDDEDDEYLNLRSVLPFCIYQHAMVEILNAYIIHSLMFDSLYPRLSGYMDPFDAINCKQLHIPKAVYEYIVGIGKVTTPTGLTVRINHPVAAMWKGPLEARSIDGHNYAAASSGTFGYPTADNHNAYECYWSGFVTRSLIEQTIIANNTKSFADWNPFPHGWLPPQSTVTPNLLGYRIPEKLGKYERDTLTQCDFANDDTIHGLLVHSSYALWQTSTTLQSIKGINTVLADFRPKENPALFLIKCRTDPLDPSKRIADYDTMIFSPYAFGASISFKAHVFAYKRRRTDVARGIFLLSPPESWHATINDNYSMKKQFAANEFLHDYAPLRDEHFSSESIYFAVSNFVKFLNNGILY